jgi:hypothetical protein
MARHTDKSPASRSDHEHATELLLTALAGIGEMLADRAALSLPRSVRARARALADLQTLTRDAAALGAAVAVLQRRPDLLP